MEYNIQSINLDKRQQQLYHRLAASTLCILSPSPAFVHIQNNQHRGNTRKKNYYFAQCIVRG